MKKLILLMIFCFTQACSPIRENPQILTVMTHDSFSVSEDVITAFEDEQGIEVKFLEAGDTGTALNKAILSKNAPLADVFYGVDNTFLSRALNEQIFEAYESPVLEDIPKQFLVDEGFYALPVDYGDICLNYDEEYFAANDIPLINSLDDLINPAYKNLIVLENPATSSPGLGFLFTTVSNYGDPGFLSYWQMLRENNIKIVNDWETAYYTEFSRWGGSRPIVLSYNSSPVFEVLFSEEPIDKPPTKAVVIDGSCYRQIEFVGILKGTENRDIAEKFIDFLLSPRFQEDIPLQMFVFPVNKNARLDDTFIKFLETPKNPIMLEPEDITLHRENWIREWTDTVIR